MLITWNMYNCEIPPQSLLLEVQYPRVVDVIQLLVPEDPQQRLMIHSYDKILATNREVPRFVQAPCC